MGDFPSTLDQSNLQGDNGFVLKGANACARAGCTVSGTGDINGDGIDDFVIGSQDASGLPVPDGVFVVFGRQTSFPSEIDLSELDGSNGFTFISGDQGAAAGDLNGDGLHDLIISDDWSRSFVVFGNRGGLPAVFDYNSLDGENRLVIYGGGRSVSGAGDVNGDGLDDVVIGTTGTQSYILFGATKFPASLDLADLDGRNGVTLTGAIASARSVSGAGDVNGDGVDDLIVGTDVFWYSAESYVVFGRSSVPPAFVRSLGDINENGTPEYVVLYQFGDIKRATVVDATTSGAALNQFEFEAEGRMVDFDPLADFSGNNIPELAALIAGSATAEVRDALSGRSEQPLSQFAFAPPRLFPIDMAIIPAQSGSGAPELAMLGRGSTKVEIRDAASGDLVENVWFPERFTPRQVLSFPDLNGNGTADIGAVLTSSSETDQVFVKDSVTGAAISNLKARRGYTDYELRQVLVVADRDGNGAPEVAMLLLDPATGDTTVWIADALTGNRVTRLGGFGKRFAPIKLAVVEDLTGDGVADYALLGRNPDTEAVRVQVKDGVTAKDIQILWYNKSYTPLDIDVIGDINGNAAQEVVLLGEKDNGEVRTFTKDAKTGELLRTRQF